MDSAAAPRGPLVLGIDSCTDQLGIAVIEGDTNLESLQVDSHGRHTETLVPELAALLDRSGRSVRDIGLIGVTIGPGRFTSLRIGLATAQGLAVGLGVRVVPIPAHLALASTAAAVLAIADDRPAPGPSSTIRQLIVPTIDGGQGVYGAVYCAVLVGGAGPRGVRVGIGLTLPEPFVDPVFGDAVDLATEVAALLQAPDRVGARPPVGVVGTGAAKVSAALGERGISTRLYPWDRIAQFVAILASVDQGSAIDPADLEPVYLRPSQAEERRGSAHRALDRTDAP